MPDYHLTPDAQSDLVEIRRYTLKQWGHSQSQKYLSELRQTIRLLAETLDLGKQRLDVASDVFSFPYVSHIIYYVIHTHELIVFGILHKRMAPFNHLENRAVI